MATITGTATEYIGWVSENWPDRKFGHAVDFFWETVGDDDTGTYFPTAGLADKTVQMSGTWGAGTVVLQGSNDAVTWFTLTNAADGEALSFAADGMAVVLENPLYIRPVSASGSSNDVDVHVLARLTI